MVVGASGFRAGIGFAASFPTRRSFAAARPVRACVRSLLRTNVARTTLAPPGPAFDPGGRLRLATLVSMPQGRRGRQVGLRRRRVLVVEDDDSFAEALRQLLEADSRLEIVGRARGGREEVELAEELRPDVVLMDIVRPVMDGVEATREIRRRQPTIHVVGVTGSGYEERALEVQDAGAVDFVRKGRLDPDLVEIVVAAAHHHRRGGRGRRHEQWVADSARSDRIGSPILASSGLAFRLAKRRRLAL
jgi:CheY-like chemotaxis protein